MSNKTRYIIFIIPILITMPSKAQNIPDALNPGRIIQDYNTQKKHDQSNDWLKSKVFLNSLDTNDDLSSESKNISFTLHSLKIQGMSIFDEKDFEKLYSDKIGKKIKLEFIWELTNKITQAYKDKGYFLSKAYIPDQKITHGRVKILVVEGYISNIDLDESIKDNSTVKKITKKILNKKPLHIHEIENALNTLNNLYGYSFESQLIKTQDGIDGTTTLVLSRKNPKENNSASAIIAFNNYSSEALGNYKKSFTVDYSFFDYHNTSASLQVSMPWDKKLLTYNFAHKFQIQSDLELEILTSNINSEPQSKDESNFIKIKSSAFSLGLSATWTPLRLRDKKLSISTSWNYLDSNVYAFSVPITKDRIKVARALISYDFTDKFLNLNTASITLSHGIRSLITSNNITYNASRAGSKPDFTKLETSYKIQGWMTTNFTLNTSVAFQISSGNLLSSETFSYGGNIVGRAYESSEITGDHGIYCINEINYLGINKIQNVKINPFVFHDYGRIWNDHKNYIRTTSGSSAGVGMHINSVKGLMINTLIAVPLNIPSTIGKKNRSSVFKFSVSHDFAINPHTKKLL